MALNDPVKRSVGLRVNLLYGVNLGLIFITTEIVGKPNKRIKIKRHLFENFNHSALQHSSISQLVDMLFIKQHIDQKK